MTVCKYFLAGRCSYGDHCRFVHPGSYSSGPGSTQEPYTIDGESIKRDLTKERPQWILSSYAPGKDPPAPLIEKKDYSPEEIRFRAYELRAQGNSALYEQEYFRLVAEAEAQMKNIINDIPGAVKYLQDAYKAKHGERKPSTSASTATTTTTTAFGTTLEHSTSSSPFGSTTPFGQPAPTTASTSNPFQSAANKPASQPAFGQPTTPSTFSPFGQPSSLGQPAFGKPAFGQPAFGQPAFGQPAFGKPALGQPALGQPTLGQPTLGQPALGQPALGQPAFGQPAFGQPAFGQPAFGKPAFSQPAFSQPAFGQSAFGQSGGGVGNKPAFGQPAFGQPAFGQTAFSNPQQQASAFGPPGVSSTSPFAAPVLGEKSTESAFVAPSATSTFNSVPPAQAANPFTTSSQSPAQVGQSTQPISSPFTAIAQPSSGTTSTLPSAFPPANPFTPSGFSALAAPTRDNPFQQPQKEQQQQQQQQPTSSQQQPQPQQGQTTGKWDDPPITYTEEELAMFKAPMFQLGRVPLVPPPKELCL